MTQECKCCGRVQDTRMGFCFTCVEMESILVEGADMWDKKIPQEKGLTNGMAKLKYLLQNYLDFKK